MKSLSVVLIVDFLFSRTAVGIIKDALQWKVERTRWGGARPPTRRTRYPSFVGGLKNTASRVELTVSQKNLQILAENHISWNYAWICTVQNLCSVSLNQNISYLPTVQRHHAWSGLYRDARSFSQPSCSLSLFHSLSTINEFRVGRSLIKEVGRVWSGMRWKRP